VNSQVSFVFSVVKKNTPIICSLDANNIEFQGEKKVRLRPRGNSGGQAHLRAFEIRALADEPSLARETFFGDGSSYDASLLFRMMT